MKTRTELTRREFLKSFSVSGTGLLVGIYLSACGDAAPSEMGTISPSLTPADEPALSPTQTPQPTPNPEASFEAGIFIHVDGTGTITVYVPRTEMGQGSLTSLAMVVAEEMDAPLDQVVVEHSPIDRAYGELRTGGSDSISGLFTRLSKASSVARAVLVAAAAQLWEVPFETCRTENGYVIHSESEAELAYAELVETAAQIPISDVADLAETKEVKDYKIIGTGVGPRGCQEMVAGGMTYGTDITLPGMLYAALKRCPVLRGTPASFDASRALAIPGVQQVFAIDSGVAVVAENTWAAFQGQQALEVTWDEGGNAGLSSSALRDQYVDGLDAGQETDASILAAIYEVPFFVHAPLEPMNCTAHVQADRCEVWAPTQNPGDALVSISIITGLPGKNIHIHIPRVGGGFGRRLQVDYIEQVVQIASRVDAPVKLLWTREDDIQQGYFHPLSVHHASTNLDNPGMPRVRSTTYQGWGDLTYAWRSVANFTDAFVQECFLDEMADALARDPYELRLELEPSSMLDVLQLAANKAGWGEPLPAGMGRGIACWSTWNTTPVAQVAEVSVSPGGEVKVHRVVCAIKCGLAVNPDMVAAQMEGGIVWGLTAALKGSIDIENGRVLQGNFDDYPILRINEMPQVEVHIVPSDRRPSGVGEMGVPPAAPAVLNAVFDATGVRIRHLPIRPGDLL